MATSDIHQNLEERKKMVNSVPNSLGLFLPPDEGGG